MVGLLVWYRLVIFLFLWFIVSVYWIRLLVLMLMKLILWMKWFNMMIVDGILIIILIGSFLLKGVFFLCKLFIILVSISFVWCNLGSVVISGNMIFMFLIVLICKIVCSCVWKLVRFCNERWIFCRFRKGLCLFGFLFGFCLILLVFKLSVWIIME